MRIWEAQKHTDPDADESFNLTLSGRTVTVGEAVWRLLLLEEVAAPRELRLEEPPSSMERLAMLPEHEQVG
jgi:hypothetical protein